MLPKAQLGRVRERRTGRAPRPARRGTPLGRRPHRRRARPGGRVDDRDDLRAAGRRDRTAPTDPAAPLVVLLHGRGSNEQRDPRRSPRTCRPARRTPRCGRRSPRAAASPGSPTAASAARSPSRCAPPWTGSAAGSTTSPRPAGRCVLVGFSGGAAFAGGLVLDDPARYAGAAILYGTLPFDAGVADRRRPAGRPAGLRRPGRRRPRHPARAARPHLGLPARRVRRPHRRAAPTRRPPAHRRRRSATLGDWIAHRLALPRPPRRHPGGTARRTPRGRRLPGGELPDAPRHQARGELDDPAAAADRQRARASCRSGCSPRSGSCPAWTSAPSRISVPGARGFTLREGSADEQRSSSRRSAEFAHLHPSYDGSLHLALPPELAADVVDQGLGATPHVGRHPPLPRLHARPRTPRRRRARHRPRHRRRQPRLRHRHDPARCPEQQDRNAQQPHAPGRRSPRSCSGSPRRPRGMTTPVAIKPGRRVADHGHPARHDRAAQGDHDQDGERGGQGVAEGLTDDLAQPRCAAARTVSRRRRDGRGRGRHC